MADYNLLKTLSKDGFKTSSYAHWALPEDTKPVFDENPQDTLRETIPISNALNPFPMPKVGTLAKGTQGSYQVTTNSQHKARLFRHGNEVIGTAAIQKYDGPHSSVGRVHSVDRSKCFLDSVSSQRDVIGNQSFDPLVMQAYQEGKEREQSHHARRLELESMPLQTQETPCWTKTSPSYCNMLPALQSGNGATGTAITIHSLRGPKNVSPVQSPMLATSQQQQREVESHLWDSINQQRQQKLSTVKQNKAKCTMESTMKDSFASFDVDSALRMNQRFEVSLASRDNKVLGEEDLARIAELDRRKADRNHGMYGTEYNATMTATPAESFDPSNHKKGVFNIVQGTFQMHPQLHKPLNIQTTTTYPTSEVVPGHFLSTTQNSYRK